MIILWLVAAEHDLEALTDYLTEDNPKTGLEIFNKIRQSVEKLKAYPFLGREGRVERTRELVIPNLPYIVVYSLTKNIRILAILHTSRKWPDYFDK
ncbi:MAG TPA: type II toxin-antitoxin system RelE/ParE family toxin [Methylomirabilota bacterium]|nr:type II toxin-antitoxin system RelE/ParE family toxin [Methylomirabilota bacterium]